MGLSGVNCGFRDHSTHVNVKQRTVSDAKQLIHVSTGEDSIPILLMTVIGRDQMKIK